MNWYGTNGSGSQVAAGLRADAPDSMNGNPVMYDAVAGKIFTAGGSPSYQYSNATNLAYLITISAPPSTPNVTKLTPMTYKRAFANSVILPNGKIFVTGGQTYAVPFTDTNAVMNPELWDPDTQTFTILPPHTVPRNYHSIALLMQDGRVFTGGAGLCGNCAANHEDAQIYSPAYLFDSSGKLATRPNITYVSSSTVKVGFSFSITVDTIATDFSLIRYGSTTHTVNTDQRRIVLTPSTAGGNGTIYKNGTTYSFTLPSDPGIALPGYWMLFALNAAGVPSISENILVTL
jgi:galactose oxidase